MKALLIVLCLATFAEAKEPAGDVRPAKTGVDGFADAERARLDAERTRMRLARYRSKDKELETAPHR